MNKLLAIAAVVMAVVLSAVRLTEGGQCPLLIKQLKEGVANVADASKKAAFERLTDEAQQLHDAGKHPESVKKCEEAAKVAGIELHAYAATVRGQLLCPVSGVVSGEKPWALKRIRLVRLDHASRTFTVVRDSETSQAGEFAFTELLPGSYILEADLKSNPDGAASRRATYRFDIPSATREVRVDSRSLRICE